MYDIYYFYMVVCSYYVTCIIWELFSRMTGCFSRGFCVVYVEYMWSICGVYIHVI